MGEKFLLFVESSGIYNVDKVHKIQKNPIIADEVFKAVVWGGPEYSGEPPTLKKFYFKLFLCNPPKFLPKSLF